MIDFIIPHMGRSDMLMATIESILTQDSVDFVGKIIVVSKNDTTPEIPVSPLIDVILVSSDINISQQRNIGVQKSNAEYLAFLDADIELASNWIGICFSLLKGDTHRVLVSAMQKCKRPKNKIERLRTTLSNTTIDDEVAFLPGRNLLVSRLNHDRVGGFPEHLETCEDYYYTDKLNKIGPLFYTSRSYYFHLGEDLTLKQTFKKEIWRSEYNLYSIKGRHVPLREWPSIILPFWITLFIAGALISLIPWPVVSLFFTTAALLPALMYTVRLSVQPNNTVNRLYILIFYSTYFIARALGTMLGLKHLWLRKTKHEA